MDRTDAAPRLAEALARCSAQYPLVPAAPRGSAPVAMIIAARAAGAPRR